MGICEAPLAPGGPQYRLPLWVLEYQDRKERLCLRTGGEGFFQAEGTRGQRQRWEWLPDGCAGGDVRAEEVVGFCR